MAILAIFGAVTPAASCAPRQVRDPDRSFALYQVALSSFQATRLEAALAEAGKALKADSDNAEAHNLIGLILLRQGAAYVAQVETVACVRGRDGAMVGEESTKKFREAAESFQRATAVRDDYAAAWNNLSVAAIHMQDWGLAISAAGKALESGTYNEPYVAHGNRGWAYFHSKDLQKAWRDLHDAVTTQPAFCVGRYRLAKVLVDRQQFEDAGEHLDTLLADKRCPIQEAYLLAGLVARKRSFSDRAHELFAACIPLAPKSCVAEECRRFDQMVN